MMEDCKVHYDGTVRSSSGLILQFNYGSDGLDSTKLEKDEICSKVFGMNDAALAAAYQISFHDDWTTLVDAKTRTAMRKDAGLEAALDAEFQEVMVLRGLLRNQVFRMPIAQDSLECKRILSIATYLPVNIPRLVDKAKAQFRNRRKLSDLNPRYVLDQVDALIVRVSGLKDEGSAYVRAFLADNRLMYRIVLRLYLSVKRVIEEFRLSKDMFDYIVLSIEERFRAAIVHPGEMVGIIAAQSMGQPTTQLTLNTFHASGLAQQFSTTEGVPRIEELISASKNPKTPSITIYLKPEFANDEQRADVVVNKLRQTRMMDIAKSSEIVYDPIDSTTLIDGDADFLRSYHAFMKQSCDYDSPWVLRIELDREKMVDRHIKMWELQYKLEERFSDQLQCIFSDDNAQKLMIRLRVNNDGVEQDDEDADVIFLLKQLERTVLDNLVLRGVPGISNAFIPTRETRPIVVQATPDGGFLESQDNREIVIIAEQDNLGENSMLEVFKLPEVDFTRTMTNYMGDAAALLGVEAARNLLLRELSKTFSGTGSYLNYRHIELLVDTMTIRGATGREGIIPITRNGIGKLSVGPLARCSFEETEQQFTNASAFAETDSFRGVSSNIMLGQLVPGGTGECDVLLDEDMLMEHLHVDEPIPEGDDEAAAAEESEAVVPEFGFDFSVDDDVETPFQLDTSATPVAVH